MYVCGGDGGGGDGGGGGLNTAAGWRLGHLYWDKLDKPILHWSWRSDYIHINYAM